MAQVILEPLVIPESHRDAIAKGVEKVVLPVAGLCRRRESSRLGRAGDFVSGACR